MMFPVSHATALIMINNIYRPLAPWLGGLLLGGTYGGYPGSDPPAPGPDVRLPGTAVYPSSPGLPARDGLVGSTTGPYMGLGWYGVWVGGPSKVVPGTAGPGTVGQETSVLDPCLKYYNKLVYYTSYNTECKLFNY